MTGHNCMDPLRIRNVLGRKEWYPPEMYPQHSNQPGQGYQFDSRDGRRILVTAWREDGADWIHASISHHDAAAMPTYDDLKLLHRAIWGGVGHSYQVFVPEDKHINIRSNVLHLWGKADGQPVLPDFGKYGTI